MEEKEQKTVDRVKSPTASLRNLGKNRTLEFPRTQKESMETTKRRIYDESPEKKFKTTLMNDYYYTIKRIK